MREATVDHLSPLDLAFWRMESPDHPMHLAALVRFTADGPDAAQRALEELTRRAAGVPGLRRRIRDVLLPVGAARWAPDPGFDPARHVGLVRTTAHDPHRAAGPLMARPLARDRPPWEAHVIAGPDPAGFAVLFKFHHALADGLGALALAAALFDEADQAPAAPRPASPPRGSRPGPRVPAADPGSRPLPAAWPPAALRALPGALASPSGLRALPGALATRSGLRALPGALASRVQDLGQALEIGAAVARSGLPLGVPDGLTTPGTHAGERSTAGVALPLDEVNRIRRAGGGTVNDVLTAVVAGALRRWLTGRGEQVDGAGPRALIPVSRRRPRGTAGAGNRLSGYLIRLPVALPEPLDRLDAVRSEMDRNKEAGPTRGAGAVALLADHVHPLGHRLGGPLLAHAARLLFDVLVTSVPLPGLTLTLAGSRVAEVYPLAPLASGQSLAVAVSTYQGTAHFGLVADTSAVPDLPALAQALHDELADLLRAAA
ncbi:wax ester/triacylglycerol synthase family O-acyltransferase [Streptomyces sp. NPDC089919]|uniref:wax ester/triacylglycerol synthase family O-acyltransferase n=1 Tax=Streptomyces sp. NPDC089919 TaxID=3155188 RepID=UPI003437D7ED